MLKKVQIKIPFILKRMETHKLMTAFVINAVFLTLVLIFCEVKYETSDDYIMAAIISGAYGGVPNPHMIFINILWGYFLLPFYYMFPQVSWYLIAQLLLCFCSFVSITYVMLKRMGIEMGVMLSILLITFFSNDAYIVMQFTKTAILAVMSGSILFLWALFYGDRNKNKELILGGILVVIGSLIRFDVIYIAGGFLIVILVIEIGKILKIKQICIWKRMVNIAVSGIILIGGALGAEMIDIAIYNSNPEYAFFREYGKLRGDIVDSRDYGYEVLEEQFKQIGLSKNDYTLLRTWNFADPQFYNLEMLQAADRIIKEYQSSLGWNRDQVKNEMRDRDYSRYRCLWACVILIIISIVFNKKYWWVSLLSSTIGYIYIYYFIASGRVVYRIEYAVFLGVALTICYFGDKEYFRKMLDYSEIRNICAILVALLCAIQIPTYRLNRWAEWIYGEEYKSHVEDNFFESWNYDSRRYRCSVYNDNAFDELGREIIEHPNNYYFMNFVTTIQTLYLADNPFINSKDEVLDNCSFLSGVTVNFPDAIIKLKENGISNPLRSMVDDNVYLVDNYYSEEILIYIREHFYPNAHMELYKTLDGFNIWKFSEE